MSKSHARRFVQSAWALLAFQLIASIGAVGVTGAAAFYVQQLAAERNALRAEAGIPPGATFVPNPSTNVPDAIQPAPAPPADATAPPADATAPPADATAPPADATAPAPLQTATVAPCSQSDGVIRVPANVEWCDTGVVLREGERFAVGAQGRWSNAGEPRYGPEGIENYRHAGSILESAALSSLIGRVGGAVFAVSQGGQMVATSSGPLHLSMNDVPGTFYDNQGYVDVFVYVSR